MRHLLVVAHPVEHSFTMSLVRTYAEEVARHGHGVTVVDLYRMGFNPVLGAHELAADISDDPEDADVVQAQAQIRSADVIAFFYPLWWLSMPAMMKGYIDRVLARGFAYEAERGVVHGLLGDKKAVLVTVSGAPMARLVETGGWQAVLALQDVHILRGVGFRLLDHLHFDGIVSPLPDDAAEQHMTRLRCWITRQFAQEIAVIP